MSNSQTNVTVSFVNDKTPGAFLYEQRPLADGEEPKHDGQDFVNEASRILNPEFIQDLNAGVLEASWKIDGTCCRIDNDEKFTYYRRRDLHTGKAMPNGALPGYVNDGKVNVCWLECKNIGEDKHHMSALECDEFGEVVGIWSVTKLGAPFIIPLTQIKTGTYELIGSKTPTDIYRLPIVQVTVNVKGKPQQVPRHYLVPHGIWTCDASLIVSLRNTQTPLDFIRDFIISNQVEGVVFKNTKDVKRIYKVNRGHIGVKIDYKNDQLFLCGSSERVGTKDWDLECVQKNHKIDWEALKTAKLDWTE